eukprot:Sdes_comp18101_c0_seq2m7541
MMKEIEAEELDEKTALIQRNKAAIYHTVGQLLENLNSSEVSVPFSREFIASLSEATFYKLEILAKDLEAFANHAKRNTIKNDDVKLAARKSPQLVSFFFPSFFLSIFHIIFL